MLPSESQALQDFLAQLVASGGIAKDPQANVLIANAVAQQPDAAYLLVQRAMMLEKALAQANAEVRQLQHALDAERASGKSTFLDDANAWGNSAKPAAPAMAVTPIPAPMPPAAASQGPVLTASNPGFFGSNAGNLLGTVAATAAGVAGGALLFQGLGSLISPHGHGAGAAGQNALSDGQPEHAGAQPAQSAHTLAADAGLDDIQDFGQDGIASGDDESNFS